MEILIAIKIPFKFSSIKYLKSVFLINDLIKLRYFIVDVNKKVIVTCVVLT